jgi:hypothetical protein
MDLDDQGGIAIDQSNEGVNENAFDFAFDLEPSPPVSPKSYLQSRSSLHDNVACAWRLPVEPYKGSDNKHLRQAYANHPYAVKYHWNCLVVRRHWHCEADQAVPADLRETTPYSMLMLMKLRQLASHSKKNIELARSLMMEAWRERVLQYEVPPPWPVQIVKTMGAVPNPNGIDKRYCEIEIEENVFGLMLADVAKAIEAALHHKQHKHGAQKGSGKRRKGEKRERQNQILKATGQQSHLRDQAPRSQSEIAARVVQRAQIRRAKQQEITRYFQRIPLEGDSRNLQPAEFATIGSNGPNPYSYTFNLPLRPRELAPSHTMAEPELSHMDDENRSSNDVEAGTEEVVFVPRGRQKRGKGVRHLARMINHVDLETSRNRGSVRQRGGEATLPLEKVDLNSLTPLHQLGMRTKSEDLVLMGQQALPD